jgi:PAS domain S-box-containing protein
VSQTASISVLHVDDEHDFAEVTAEMLEREDERFAVETAPSASDGLERLADADYDCIISDYDMPGQNGIEFLEEVRKEYPHTPFVLFTGEGSERVAGDAISAGVADYLQKGGGTEQYKLLANRVLNAVDQYRSKRRATKLDRIRTLASDVNQALVRAESREESEARVCEIISDSEPYLFAWVGDVDSVTGRIEPRTSAGVEDDYLDDITITVEESSPGLGPGGTAFRERRVAVSQDIATDPEFEPRRDEALERGYRAMAAVPIAHETSVHGILFVYADHPDAFDDNERELLAEVGDDIAHALHSFDVQEQMRQERNRRRALFENAPGPVVASEVVDDGGSIEITGVNDRFEDVFGLEPREVVGEDPAETIVPETEMAEHEEFRHRAKAGETITREVERMTTDGPHPFLIHIIPFTEGGDRISGMYVWYTDIGDRKAHERNLQLMDQLVRQMNDGIVVVQDGIITYTNPGVSELLGYSEAELADTPMGEFIAPAYREVVSRRHRARLAGDDDLPEMYEMEVVSADGEVVPVEINVSRIEYEGEAATLSLVRDITDRKERERKLQRKNERLDQFASVVSHDLRNPLHVVQGRLELAREEHDIDHLETASDAVERSLNLLDDLLTLAREGETVSEVESIDLAATVDRCWQTVETEDATLAVETDRTIRADESRLKQLLGNLIHNAVDHGGPEVSVTVGELETGFFVADDGPGIDADARDRVFETGYSTADDGTGFGLTIVEEIVEAHGWDIAVTDDTADGARFEITGVEFAAR